MERGRRSEPKGRRRVESEPRDVESERRMFEGDNFERAPNDRGRNAAGDQVREHHRRHGERARRSRAPEVGERTGTQACHDDARPRHDLVRDIDGEEGDLAAIARMRRKGRHVDHA